MCFVAVIVCTKMTTRLLVQLCKKSEETIYETCGGTLSRESTRWVCNFVYDSHQRALNWTLQRWTARTAAWKTEDTSWKAVSAIYLDNVTCHGDCECNLIVNYSSTREQLQREWTRKLKCQIEPRPDYLPENKVKRTINQSLRCPGPASQDDWNSMLGQIENTWKTRIIIVMKYITRAADNRNSYLDSIQFTIFFAANFTSTQACSSRMWMYMCKSGESRRASWRADKQQQQKGSEKSIPSLKRLI